MRRVCLLPKPSEREAARGGDEDAQGEHEDVRASVRTRVLGWRGSSRSVAAWSRRTQPRTPRGSSRRYGRTPSCARSPHESASAHGRRPFAGSPWSEGGVVPLRDQPAGTGPLPPVSRGTRQDHEGAAVVTLRVDEREAAMAPLTDEGTVGAREFMGDVAPGVAARCALDGVETPDMQILIIATTGDTLAVEVREGALIAPASLLYI